VSAFLEVEGLSKDFGGLRAVAELDLVLAEGELLCIIGPNGCGKTTLFNLLSGQFPPSSGSIRFRDRSISGLEPFEVSRLGIGRKFQIPGIYPDLTVRENLVVPLFAEVGRRGLWALTGARRGGTLDQLLELTGLAARVEDPAGTLAHGEKQWLEIGMVLAAQPRLMLLDEPTAGMTVAETAATADLLLHVRRQTGVAAIVIEHDMGFVRQLQCPIAVMMNGRLLTRGSYAEISANPEVRNAYLGARA
jgi:ABC-type uncharacterized transport system ATPase subunit